MFVDLDETQLFHQLFKNISSRIELTFEEFSITKKFYQVKYLKYRSLSDCRPELIRFPVFIFLRPYLCTVSFQQKSV